MRNLFIAAILFFFSCTSVKQIGSLTMISTRNIDPSGKYKMIRAYAGDTRKELIDNRAATLEQAVNNFVKRVPGGEYVMNVKVYQVGSKAFAAAGDVWGVDREINYMGFRAGDSIMYKNWVPFAKEKYLPAVIHALKDDKYCVIRMPDGANRDIKYEDLTKKSTSTPK